MSEQSKKRDQNRYKLLQAIQFQGPLRRSELSEFCSIRKSSVTSIVDELIQDEVLVLTDPGRPRSPLMLNPNRWRVACINLSPDSITTGLVGLDGKLEAEKRDALDSSLSADEILTRMIDGIKRLVEDKPDGLLGIGVALPGIVDSRTGICHRVVNLPNFNAVNIGEAIRENFNCPFIVENDVRASLWASIWFDQLVKRYSDALYLDITNGIGSALLIGGRPHIGCTFTAGEIGHLPAGDEKRPCRCGKIDCLETYCSIPALLNEIKTLASHLGPLNSAKDIASLANSQPVVGNILDRCARRLARPLSVMVACVDPQVIILGNQAPEFYEVIMPLLRHHLRAELQGIESGLVDIIIARSAEHTATRGVAGLLIDKCFQARMESGVVANA